MKEIIFMTNTKKAVAILAALLVAGVSYAADESTSSQSSTSIKAKDVTTKKNDIDQEITNAALRVQSGSKKKYSLSSSINYAGGNLSQPFGDLRPNLKGQEGTETVTSLGGSISGRYRLNKRASVSLGIGLGLGTPFNSDQIKSNNASTFADRVYVSDPSVGFSYAAKVGDFQMISGAGIGVGTSENSVLRGLEWSAGVDNTFLAQTGNLTWGLASTLYYTQLGGVSENIPGEKEGSVKYKKGEKCTGCSVIDLGFYPFLEYTINDDMSLRTVFRWFTYSITDENISNGSNKLDRTRPDQSVGVRYSFTRDIYIYPNIQFDETLSAEQTNLAISASMNL